jgi:hypothetical protein
VAQCQTVEFYIVSRDAAFWTMVVCMVVIPSISLGFLRGRAITRAYLNIYADLKKAGIELSQADLRALIAQLRRNPKAILSTDSQDVSRNIKEQHIQALLSYLKPIRYAFAVLFVIAVVAIVLFQHLWPNR